MARDWIDMLDAVIVPTDQERTVTEYRDKDGAMWYTSHYEMPDVIKRQVRQRLMQHTNTDGTVSYFWETLSTEGSE